MIVEKVTVTTRSKEDGVVRDFKLSSLERGKQVSIRCMDTKDVLPHLDKIINEYGFKDSVFTIAAIKELCEMIEHSIDIYERMSEFDKMPILDSLSAAHGIDASKELEFFMQEMAESQSDGDKEKYQKMIKLMEDRIALQNIERAKL